MKSSVVAQCKRSCSLNRQSVNSYSMQRDIAAVSVTLIVLGLIGCASDAPNVRYAQRMRPETRILQNDEVRAAIIPSSGVTISPYERDRFAEQIVRAVRITAHGGARTPSAYDIQVQLTKYNKGSAAARFILAGLGQIHIVGNVSVFEGNVSIAQFHIEKFSEPGLDASVITF